MFNFREVSNYCSANLSGCQEQNTDGQFTKPFWSDCLLLISCPAMKGSGFVIATRVNFHWKNQTSYRYSSNSDCWKLSDD